jgi:hypothetical protein
MIHSKGGTDIVLPITTARATKTISNKQLKNLLRVLTPFFCTKDYIYAPPGKGIDNVFIMASKKERLKEKKN